MCGIAGFVGARSDTLLAEMVGSLFHRGPDDAGYWNDGHVFLGMRRLAIVDVETGQQPVFNEDDSVVVVFNGEIYNHVELRAELIARGHGFRTDHSDTEVLVHLYEEHGEAFSTLLNGMFAIALFDRRRSVCCWCATASASSRSTIRRRRRVGSPSGPSPRRCCCTRISVPSRITPRSTTFQPEECRRAAIGLRRDRAARAGPVAALRGRRG